MDQPPPLGTDDSIAARAGLALGEFVVRYVLWFCGSALGLGAILEAIKIASDTKVPETIVTAALWGLAILALVAAILHTRIKSTRAWRTSASFSATVLKPVALIVTGLFELIAGFFKAMGALIGIALVLGIFLFVIIGVFGVLLFGVKQVF